MEALFPPEEKTADPRMRAARDDVRTAVRRLRAAGEHHVRRPTREEMPRVREGVGARRARGRRRGHRAI